MRQRRFTGTGVGRRDALSLMALGAAAGTVSLLGRGAVGAASQVTARRPGTFPPKAVIRALLQDLAPADVRGALLFHEHLNGTTKFNADVDLMVAEVAAAGKDGIGCIVDGGHADMGRNLEALKRIARESGVPIVASGGYYTERSYPPEVASRTVEQIADDLVSEATTNRYGAFGEIGQSGGVLTATEVKVFRAVGQAQARTGLPIFTHNSYTGTRTVQTPIPREAALRQLDALETGGATPAHVAIGHVCCLHDPKAEIAIRIARRGAFVGFDRVTLESIMLPDADRVVMVMALVEAGHVDKLLLSSDFFAETSLKKNGGAGIAQTTTVFGPKLRKAGLPEPVLMQILHDNPRRFLAFVPRI